MRILAVAVQNRVHTGVDDPEQAWILSELIRYLEHPASGASEMADMGPSWVAVRDGARDRSLKKSMVEVADVAGRWDQLIRQAALNLCSETGADVIQLLPRAQQDAKARTAILCESLAEAGQLSAELRVPGTAGDLEVVGDIRSRQIVVSTTIDAPSDKKGRGSVSWLTRPPQIDTAPQPSDSSASDRDELSDLTAQPDSEAPSPPVASPATNWSNPLVPSPTPVARPDSE